MKKYFTVIVVLLLVIIGVIIIMKNKNTKTKTITQPQNISQTEQTSSTSNYESYPVSTFPTTSQIDYKAIAEAELKKQENQKKQSNTSNQQNLPPQYIQLMGGCNKTIDDIIKDYGKVWGEVKPERNEKGQLKETFEFTNEENENFLKIFLKYARCEGIVNRSIEKCYSLVKNIDFNKNKNVCNESFDDIMFLAYTLNKKGAKYEFCSKFFSKVNSPSISPRIPKTAKEKIKNANEKVFCELAQKGINSLCNNLAKLGLINSNDFDWCYKIFPEQEGHCSMGNEFCLKSIAVTKNDITLCNNYDDCQFLIKDNCDEIRSQVILTYCNFYRRVEGIRKAYEEEEKMKQKFLEFQKNIRGGNNESKEKEEGN
jgi:hypothetical protein